MLCDNDELASDVETLQRHYVRNCFKSDERGGVTKEITVME